MRTSASRTSDDDGFASATSGMVWRLPNSVSTLAGGILPTEGMFALPFFIASGLYALGIRLSYALFKDANLRK